MKYFITLLCLWSLNLYAQTFDGIGKLKIGMQSAEMMKHLNVEKSKFRNVANNDVTWSEIYDAGVWAVMEYNPPVRPKDDLVYRSYIHCPGATVYLIPKYTVSGIDIESVSLLFINDTLIQIEIKNPSFELTEAINTKYGKGITKDTSNTVVCASMYGNTEYREVTFITKWPTQNGIEAQKYLRSFRNDNCKELFVSYVRVCDVDRRNRAFEANEVNWQKVRHEILDRKMKELEEL